MNLDPLGSNVKVLSLNCILFLCFFFLGGGGGGSGGENVKVNAKYCNVSAQ